MQCRGRGCGDITEINFYRENTNTASPSHQPSPAQLAQLMSQVVIHNFTRSRQDKYWDGASLFTPLRPAPARSIKTNNVDVKLVVIFPNLQ